MNHYNNKVTSLIPYKIISNFGHGRRPNVAKMNLSGNVVFISRINKITGRDVQTWYLKSFINPALWEIMDLELEWRTYYKLLSRTHVCWFMWPNGDLKQTTILLTSFHLVQEFWQYYKLLCWVHWYMWPIRGLKFNLHTS